jgi:hypothetical protein
MPRPLPKVPGAEGSGKAPKNVPHLKSSKRPRRLRGFAIAPGSTKQKKNAGILAKRFRPFCFILIEGSSWI